MRTARRRYGSPAKRPRRRGAAVAGQRRGGRPGGRRSIAQKKGHSYVACSRNGIRNSHFDAAGGSLLDDGAEVDRAKEDGATPLFVACDNGRVDAARLLLENGAEVDRATENGQTPLFIACSEGHVEVARLLLDKGAAVDRAKETGGRRCMSPARTATSTRRGCC